jgi:hypothetical protein
MLIDHIASQMVTLGAADASIELLVRQVHLTVIGPSGSQLWTPRAG